MSDKTKVMFPDSMESLVYHLAKVAKEPVFWGNPLRYVWGPVTKVTIGPSFQRGFHCPDGCSACCSGVGSITKDWLPYDTCTLQGIGYRTVRTVWVQGKVYTITTDMSYPCPYLSQGLCLLWPDPPLECAAAPNIRFISRGKEMTSVQKRPFGRAWAFNPRPQCQFGVGEWNRERDISLLNRYLLAAQHFGIDTWLSEIISLLDNEVKTLEIF